MAEENPRNVQIEFAVQMTCKKCENAVQKALESNKDIKHFDIDLKNERVVVQTNLPSEAVLSLIEKTGRKAIVRGVGTQAVGMKGLDFGSGVSIIHKGADHSVMGVTRFFQPTDNECVVEGTVEGLTPHSKYAVQVHELGDLSSGCNSCGPVFSGSEMNKVAGNLGVVSADDTGRVNFQLSNNDLKLWNIIGRSVVLHHLVQDKPPDRVACGIIARSAGLFSNVKKVCACDGVSLWEEKERSNPLPSASL